MPPSTPRARSPAGRRWNVGNVNDISDAQLVERAVRNATITTKQVRGAKRPRWAAVMDAFGLGSTYAAQLCRRFGLDPNEEINP